MAMYSGQQYIGWNTRIGGVQELKAPSHRILVVDNRLMPKVRAKISRQMTRPGVQVVPDSKSEMDMKRAAVKERILMHFDQENALALKQFSLSQWGAVTGGAFTDVDWRDAGGAMYRDGQEEFSEGEIRLKIRSYWEAWPAPDAKLHTWGSWCFIAELYDVDVAKDEFGVKDIRADGDEFLNPFRQAQAHGFFQSSSDVSTLSDHKSEDKNKCLVKRLFIFPTNKNPEGKEVLIINGKEQRKSKLMWFPLVHYVNAPYFDRFHGDTELRQCIPLQKARNRMRSSIQEYLRTMVKGKYISHKSNKLGSSALNTEHLEIVQYEGSAPPPQQMSIPGLPADVWQELAINDASMDDIFADRPSSQGRKESGVESGKHTQLLQQEDDRQHTPGVSLYEQCWKKTYEKVLELASRKYSDNKQIMVVGEDKEWDLQIIKRNLDENGNPTGEDLLGGRNRVHITLGSSLPPNKQARRARIIEDWQLGLYGDPMDPAVRRKVMLQTESGVVGSAFDDDKQDETRAFEENQMMMLSFDGEAATGPVDGEIMSEVGKPPEPFENHMIHMTIHNRARKGRDYRQMDDAQKVMFDTHCEMHEQYIAEQMMAMQPPEEGGQPGNEAATPEAAIPAAPVEDQNMGTAGGM
jgi:hypothetical protein